MTGADLEAAAADSVRDLFRRKPEPFTRKGEPCANCGTPLEGHYCYECGQDSDTHHRTLPHLIWEAIEGMFHLDGRLARTLPLLFFKPGVLAKDYMEGRIARHVPPFRTFLVALLLFIFAAEHAIHGMQHKAHEAWEARAERMKTPQGRMAEAMRLRTEATSAREVALKEIAADRQEELADKDNDSAKVLAQHAKAAAVVETQYAKAMARADQIEHDPEAAIKAVEAGDDLGKAAAKQIRSLDLDLPAKDAKAKTVTSDIPFLKVDKKAGRDEHWLRNQIAKAVENPEYYFMVMFGWAHRLAVLLLPILGLSLALVYVNKRQYYIYDHLLVATNLLSFAFLTNAFGLILPTWAAVFWFILLAVWTPVNLFQTLRGGYGSGIVGAAIKTLIVWFVSVTAFSTLLATLMFFTLAQI
jgi:hypothetical protein